MDTVDDSVAIALAGQVRELMDRNKILWIRVATAQANEDRYLWLRDVWWDQRKPDISQCNSRQLDGVVDGERMKLSKLQSATESVK